MLEPERRSVGMVPVSWLLESQRNWTIEVPKAAGMLPVSLLPITRLLFVLFCFVRCFVLFCFVLCFVLFCFEGFVFLHVIETLRSGQLRGNGSGQLVDVGPAMVIMGRGLVGFLKGKKKKRKRGGLQSFHATLRQLSGDGASKAIVQDEEILEVRGKADLGRDASSQFVGAQTPKVERVNKK